MKTDPLFFPPYIPLCPPPLLPSLPFIPLLFITPLVKPAHPEITDFRGGWAEMERDKWKDGESVIRKCKAQIIQKGFQRN